jgi:hypothetical protein
MSLAWDLVWKIKKHASGQHARIWVQNRLAKSQTLQGNNGAGIWQYRQVVLRCLFAILLLSCLALFLRARDLFLSVTLPGSRKVTCVNISSLSNAFCLTMCVCVCVCVYTHTHTHAYMYVWAICMKPTHSGVDVQSINFFILFSSFFFPLFQRPAENVVERKFSAMTCWKS